MSTKRKYEKRAETSVKLPLTKEIVSLISTWLVTQGRHRDHALYCAGIDSMARASDLTRLLVEDVTDEHGSVVRDVRIRMKKTADIVEFRLSERTREAITTWLQVRQKKSSKWLFYGRPWWEPMTEARYRQLAKEWFRAAGLPIAKYSTHSIRRTRATLLYEKTNNIKAVSELLGHRNVTTTERYINVDRKKALDVADSVDIWS